MKPYDYGYPVKISNWHDRVQSYPLDNANPNYITASHYRTFGDPKADFQLSTTTRDQLESGIRFKLKVRRIAKKQINFVSYPMNDVRFNEYQSELHDVKPTEKITSTYREVYKAPKPIIEAKNVCETALDPLLNRKSKNDFEMLPSSTNKFMDDHFINLTEGRKKINFLRQLRDSTYILGK